MKAFRSSFYLFLFVLLLSFIFTFFIILNLCPDRTFAADDQVQQIYSKCVQLYSEYMQAVNNNLDGDTINKKFNEYKSALENYKNLLNKSGGDEILKKISELPDNTVNAFNSSRIQDIVNSGIDAGASTKTATVLSSAVLKTSGVVTASVLNVRSGPWGEIIGTFNSGSKVEIISKQGSWYKVLYNGREAYIHSGYVATADSIATAYDGYVTSAGLNVRSAPFGNILGVLNQGTAIEVLEKKGDWLVIKYDGREAFVHSDYISKSTSPPAVKENTAASSQPSSPVSSYAASSANNMGVNLKSFTAGFNSSADMIGGPVPPARITSTFGPRELFGKNYHYGVDIAVPTGTPLRSLGSGKVISTNYDYGGGKGIIIKYDNGYTSVYYHCRDANVSAGDTVKKGDIVGHSNNTGAHTTGPHLHFGLKDAGNKYIDPLKVPSLWY